MSKYEFLTQLEEQLRGNVSSQELRDSVNYYQEYIEGEIRSGKSEAEVLEELGSAYSIAKSIIDARGCGADNDTGTVYEEERYPEEKNRASGRVFLFEGWKSKAILIGIIAVLILIVVFAFRIVAALLPFAVPFMLVVLLFKLFTDRR